MKKAKHVFASKGERNAFKTIQAGLPLRWSLHSNLPLSQIVEVGKDEVCVGDWDFYLKTSVDFVITYPADNIALAMEFDGLRGGFSAGSIYRPSASDPNRERTLNFKLPLCRAAGLPLCIISFDEIKVLPGDDAICLVHSIVAQHIAAQEMGVKLQHWDRNDRGRGKTFDEMLWDWSNAWTSLQHNYDPFLKGLDRLWERFSQLGVKSWSLEALSRPDLSQCLAEKRPIESVGCRFTALGDGRREGVTVTVWVRNFAGERKGRRR